MKEYTRYLRSSTVGLSYLTYLRTNSFKNVSNISQNGVVSSNCMLCLSHIRKPNLPIGRCKCRQNDGWYIGPKLGKRRNSQTDRPSYRCSRQSDEGISNLSKNMPIPLLNKVWEVMTHHSRYFAVVVQIIILCAPFPPTAFLRRRRRRDNPSSCFNGGQKRY